MLLFALEYLKKSACLRDAPQNRAFSSERLAKRLNMKRVSLYPLLEALQAKALVHFEERDSGRFDLARSPERLLSC